MNIIDESKRIAQRLKIEYKDSIFEIDDSGNYDYGEIVIKNQREFIKFISKVIDYIDNQTIIDSDLIILQKSDNITMIINNKIISQYSSRIQKLIMDEISKMYDKYILLYKDKITFDQLFEKNNEVKFLGKDPLYSHNEEENQKIMEDQIKDRSRQLKKCSEHREFDPLYKYIYDHEISYNSNFADTKSNVVNFCNHAIWGSEMLGNTCSKEISLEEINSLINGEILSIDHYLKFLPDHVRKPIIKSIEYDIKGKNFLPGELMLDTLKSPMIYRRQYVFGYTRHIDKYKHCPKYFICGTMKRPLIGLPACDVFADWSRKLNTLYTQCAVSSTNMSPFIRFVMPPDMLPQKRYDDKTDILDYTIFNKLPVAVMITKFVDNRKRETKHKTELLLHYIFFDIDADLEYKTMYELGSLPVPTRLKIYSSIRREIILGQIFYSTPITYNEFIILFIYRKIKNVYRSKKYKYILFLTNNDFENEYIHNIGLERVDIKYKTLSEIPGTNVERTYIYYDNQSVCDLQIFDMAIKNKKIHVYQKNGNNLIDQFIVTNQPMKRFVQDQMNVKYFNPNNLKYDHCPHTNLIGGTSNSNSNIEIEIKDKSKNNGYGYFDDKLIGSTLLKDMLKLNISSTNLITEEDKSYYQISRYLDPHMLVDMVNVSALRRKTDFKYTYDRYFRSVANTVDQLLNMKQKYMYLTVYRPLTDKFFNRFELLYNFKLIKSGSNILIYGHSSLSDLEAINYYKLRYNLNDLTLNLIYHPDIYLIDKESLVNKIRHLSKFIKFNIIEDKKLFEPFSFNKQVTRNYDCIFDDYIIRSNKISHEYNEYYHLRLKFASMLFALQNLKPGGNYIFFSMNLMLKAYCDMVLILSRYFVKYDLYSYEIQAKYKLIYSVVVFTEFIGIDLDSYKQISNIYESVIENSPDIFKDNLNNNTFINSLINIDVTDGIYDQFRNFNNQVFFDKVSFLKKCKKAVMNGFILDSIISDVKYTSFLYTQKYNFDIVDIYNINKNYNFNIEFLQDVYFPLTSVNYSFIKNTEYLDMSINNQYTTYNILDQNLLEDNCGRLAVTDLLIDTRNISKWYQIKQYVRYFRPFIKFDLDLRTYVSRNYNTGKISQAWLKMYEILANVKLFDPNKKELNTFHICEAPGSFILAINQYIYTNTNIEKFNWIANSLNPVKDKKQNSKTAFGDHFGLMKYYKSNWDFGADNTGDITHIANINHYKKVIDKMNNVDLITADCGIPMEENNNSNAILLLHMAEMSLILYSLPKGSSFVAKYFFPIHFTIEYHLFYLLFNCFSNLIFYKPRINIYSKEFYVLGIGYLGLKDTTFDYLFSLLNKETFNIDKKIYDNIPDWFMQQLSIVHNKMTSDYIFNFKKQLYYVDNHDMLGEKFLKEIKKNIYRKNIQWCNDTRLKILHDKYKLV